MSIATINFHRATRNALPPSPDEWDGNEDGEPNPNTAARWSNEDVRELVVALKDARDSMLWWMADCDGDKMQEYDTFWNEHPNGKPLILKQLDAALVKFEAVTPC